MRPELGWPLFVDLFVDLIQIHPPAAQKKSIRWAKLSNKETWSMSVFPKRVVAAFIVLMASSYLHAASLMVDDFESGLNFQDFGGSGPVIGTFGFAGVGTLPGGLAIGTTNSHPPLPGENPSNNVLQLDADTPDFAGVLHFFESPGVDAWVSQDWSAYDRFEFMLLGQNTGNQLFVDINDNRANPGGNANDAEVFSFGFVDDFNGWQLVSINFDSFTRKEIGNGAPNDGLTLTQMHGWAFGTLATGGPVTYYLDNVSVSAVPIPPAIWLFASALIGAGFLGRRKQKV